MNSENFSNNRHDAQQYVETYVVDAVRMVPSRNSLYMMMADGSEVEVAHVNPTAGRLLYQASTPTIFLRVAENSSLMLPIVVGDLAVALLMKAIREEHGARPNYYELMGNMLQALEHKVKLVKITQRVVDTYYAQIFIEKEGGESSQTLISIDARPSDAINLAVRCKVPIFVSRSIIMNDAVRLVTDRTSFDGRELLTHDVDITLDRPQTNLDIVSEEITLMMAMLSAAEEERYADAAKFRDDLASLRRKSRKHLNKVVGFSNFDCSFFSVLFSENTVPVCAALSFLLLNLSIDEEKQQYVNMCGSPLHSAVNSGHCTEESIRHC
eukprot:TRINITY_DN697_c0_g1_i1.p1 TRINITY_DN697_c0_g1~~TRINITY_DN697_c0_g1_i1.p1  ORF type:complete len:325 (-),score=33.97 TRINITY_DN697_c0_g1_i1:97-1071(-)